MGVAVDYVWHKEESVAGYDLIVLPGGFSYGDYLRCGAIARFSPVMKAITAAASQGTLVLGICNGFQILCEAGLLPGVLRRKLLDEGRAREAELTLADLAGGFLLGNSVRGLMKAELK